MKTISKLFIVLFFLTSCQKEVIEVIPNDGPDYAKNEVNLALQELTSLLIEASSSEAFLSELKKKNH